MYSLDISSSAKRAMRALRRDILIEVDAEILRLRENPRRDGVKALSGYSYGDVAARQLDQLLVHQLGACRTHPLAQAHDGVTVDAGHALGAADAVAFDQGADDRDLLLSGRDEAKSIRDAATRSGVTVAEWIRSKLLPVVDGPDASR